MFLTPFIILSTPILLIMIVWSYFSSVTILTSKTLSSINKVAWNFDIQLKWITLCLLIGKLFVTQFNISKVVKKILSKHSNNTFNYFN